MDSLHCPCCSACEETLFSQGMFFFLFFFFFLIQEYSAIHSIKVTHSRLQESCHAIGCKLAPEAWTRLIL